VVQRRPMSWMVGGSSPGRGWKFLSPPCPDRLWGYPVGIRGTLPGGKAAGARS
jgi:hypothetical protein